MNRYAPANYVCLSCSKKLRVSIISAEPICPRCTRQCVVIPTTRQPEEPALDKIARHAVMRMHFGPQIRKV